MDHEPVPEVFLSMSQVGADGDAGYVIRARSDDPGLPQAIARTVADQDSRIQRVNVEPLSLMLERSLEGRNAAGSTPWRYRRLGFFASDGHRDLCRIVAFRAAERSREMAIRSALGATAPQLRSLILGQRRLAMVGTLAGIAGYACAAPLLESQLYGIAVLDAPSIALVACGVCVVAVLASFAPSLGADRSAPIDLLRDS